MKTKIFKCTMLSLLMVITIQGVSSQSISRTGYFMDNATHRQLMNPALTSEKGYISLPVLGEFSMGIESNLLISTFLYPPENGGELMTFLHPDVSANEFLSKLEPVNYLRGDLRTSLLSLGVNSKAGYFTFDVATRVGMSMNLPYSLLEFLKVGMTSGQGTEYKIRDFSIGAGAYAEASLGYARNFMDNLRVGAKLKYLVGVANAKANVKSMDVYMSQQEWTISSDAQMDLYGKGFTLETETDQSITGFEFGSPGVGGSGIALDLGVTYSPIENLELSLGIVDIGSISWKKDNVITAKAAGSVSFSGLDGIGTDSVANQDVENQIEKLKEDALKMIDFKKVASADAKQKLNTTINAGAEYSLLDKKLGIGLLYTGRFMDGSTYSEIMTAATYRPVKWFELSGSYSFMHSKFKTFGLAMNVAPGFANLFIACDYLILKRTPQFIPLNTASTNVQIGLSVPLGK